MSKTHAPYPPAHDVNGPLQVDFLPIPGGGRLGMVHCPGRKGRDGKGRLWQRDLKSDLAALQAQGADTLITLVEPKEFTIYGVEDLPQAVQEAGLNWVHWPIGDMQTADGATAKTIQDALPDLVERLHQGETIIVHCAAGLGRTGTLAAQILVEAGLNPDQAITKVRATRPGTIETEAQEKLVKAQGQKPAP